MRHGTGLLVACEADIAAEEQTTQRPEKREKISAMYKLGPQDIHLTERQREELALTNPFYRCRLDIVQETAKIDLISAWMLEYKNNPTTHVMSQTVEHRAIIRTVWPWKELKGTNSKATRDAMAKAIVFEVALISDYRPRLLRQHLGVLRQLLLKATQPFVATSARFTIVEDGTLQNTTGKFWKFWDNYDVDETTLPDIKHLLVADNRRHIQEMKQESEDNEAITKAILQLEKMSISKAIRPAKRNEDHVAYEVHDALTKLATVM